MVSFYEQSRQKWACEILIWSKSRCLDDNWRAPPSRSKRTMVFIFKHIVVGQVWKELEVSSHFFVVQSSFCYNWFLLQSIAIHRNRRSVERYTTYESFFSAYCTLRKHLFVAQGVRACVGPNHSCTYHNMVGRLLFCLLPSPLAPLLSLSHVLYLQTMLIGSESRRMFNRLRLDALSIQNCVIKKGFTHLARHGVNHNSQSDGQNNSAQSGMNLHKKTIHIVSLKRKRKYTKDNGIFLWTKQAKMGSWNFDLILEPLSWW